MRDPTGLLLLLGLAVLAVPVLLLMALVSISRLKQRVGQLERELGRLHSATEADSTRTTTEKSSAPAVSTVEEDPAERAPTLAELTRRPEIQQPTAAVQAGTPAKPAPQPPPLPQDSPASLPGPAARPWTPPPPPPPSPPGPFAIAARAIQRWFTVGNVPVKIGMLVLLAGVAALLKYASDQGWLSVPIELRLAGIAAAALAGLVFGWRQRERKPAFALALQGGAIGVLLLTIFAAFKMHGLLPAGPAFGLSVLLIAGAGVLAVVQNSRTLAVLGILAGFMAPIWLSTGSGNHVALFSYYAMLNAAILAIAWWRPWRVLNLLGFVFTFGIGVLWGVLQYDASKLASTQPFLLLFFALYLAIPILYARKRPASRGDFIDGCLVFGTPLVVFTLQAGLLMPTETFPRLPLALFSLGLGALYAVLAWAFIRRERYAALGASYALLAVGFATLAVPLALTARATASVFALEGAALVWLGLRQQRWLPRLSGGGLQLLAAVALLIGAFASSGNETAVANPGFMGALLIALAGLASAWAYLQYGKPQAAALYYLWGLAWWLGNGWHEITRFLAHDVRPDALLVMVAVTGWLAAEVHRRQPAPLLALTTLGGMLAAIPLALVQADVHQQPFAGYGGWAWLVFGLLGARSLLCLRASQDRIASAAQFIWWVVWPTALSLLASWLAQQFGLALGWEVALLALPWLALLTVSLYRWNWLVVPLGDRFNSSRRGLQMLVIALLGLWWFGCLWLAGTPAPLPWIPLLNPMEMAQLLFIALTARWLWSPQAPEFVRSLRMVKLASAGFLMLTFTTLRSVHHWGGLDWSPELIASSLAQTSLTVVWSVLGVLGWVIGSRRGQRGLWLAGAVLMGIVLAKLVLVDRQHLGNLLGIGSFIAYGLLCTLVGYFAPAPPRAATEETTA